MFDLAVPVGEVELDYGQPFVVEAFVAGHFDQEDAVNADESIIPKGLACN